MFFGFNSKRNSLQPKRLNDDLEKKFVEFEKCNHQVLIASIFDWEEFNQVFKNKYCQFTFVYKTVMFTIFNCGNYAEFWIDGEENVSYKKFLSADLLLNNLFVDGNLLRNIWDDLVIAM